MFGRSAHPVNPIDVIPDGVPVLSRGRHRTPRKGACFMEMASYLAGEKWSDHPRCTHPVLGSLARCVNDALGDRRRQELASMIPEVVGLNADDPRIPATIMRRAALSALPIASAERQNVMALALIGAERHLGRLTGRGPNWLSPEARAALCLAPHAERWARDFDLRAGRGNELRQDSASKVIALAVNGIAGACVDDPSTHLVAMLRQAIDETKLCMPATPPATAVPASPPRAPSRVARG